MRILLSNDDGIDAPGLALLGAAAGLVSSDVWTVAPARKWTAASHQLSFDTTLDLVRLGVRSYRCSGSPADCVVAAMTVLLRGADAPGLVLAGINDDSNLGEDAIYSGTLAIAREAAFWGVPGIAFSRPRGSPVETGDAPCLARLIEALWAERQAWALEGHFLALNLPRRLPAPMAAARPGRDKIAGAADVVGGDGSAAIALRLRRGRPGTRAEGDEASHVAAGRIALVRYCWFAAAPLPDALLARLSARAGAGEG